MPAETVRRWRSAKTVLSEGGGIGSGVEAGYVGWQTSERRGKRCVHRAPMMVLTCALKL